jgi:hypothetical protein
MPTYIMYFISHLQHILILNIFTFSNSLSHTHIPVISFLVSFVIPRTSHVSHFFTPLTLTNIIPVHIRKNKEKRFFVLVFSYFVFRKFKYFVFDWTQFIEVNTNLVQDMKYEKIVSTVKYNTIHRLVTAEQRVENREKRTENKYFNTIQNNTIEYNIIQYNTIQNNKIQDEIREVSNANTLT